MPEAVKRRAMALYRERKHARLWHDYGPHWRRKLAEQHGVAMSRETLRKGLIEAKLWRARGARYGELLQWDTGNSIGSKGAARSCT
jgi:hypothetical protein